MSANSKYRESKEKFELKEKAIVYYKENGVPQKMEEILNSMFFDDPEDVYGHLANYFEKFIKDAVVTKLTAHQVLDGRGHPTIQTQVYCQVKNNEQVFSTCISPSPNTHLLDNARPEEKEAEDARRLESVKMAVAYIGGEIATKLKGMKPTQQAEVDTLISLYMQMLKEEDEARNQSEEAENPVEEAKPPPQSTSPAKDKKGGKSSAKAKGKATSAVVIPEEPRETFVSGAELVSAVSQAVCVAGARSQHLPVYQHIANLYNPQATQLRMPLPLVPILQSGKAAAGKLNCVKEFMVVPSPGLSFTQSLEYITGIFAYCEKSLSVKGGNAARNVNESGLLCPVYDKAEQGLDLLVEAISSLNLTPGEDVHIALNAAAHEMFEYDKGKYEVMTGILKSADDTVEFWVELMSRYPSIIMVVDPLRKQEKDQWLRLCDRITDRCFVAGGRLYPRPGLLKDATLPDPVMTGAAVLAYENLTSVTDFCACAKKMEEAGNQVIVTARAGETQDDFIADLAVAMSARFIQIGAPNRGERVSKYNRLLALERELEAAGRLAPQCDHEFRHIQLPPEDEAEASPQASPRKEEKEKGKGKK